MAEEARESIAQAQAWARRQFADQEMLQAGVDDAVRTARDAIEEARSALVEIAEASGRFKHEWEEIRTAQSDTAQGNGRCSEGGQGSGESGTSLAR